MEINPLKMASDCPFGRVKIRLKKQQHATLSPQGMPLSVYNYINIYIYQGLSLCPFSWVIKHMHNNKTQPQHAILSSQGMPQSVFSCNYIAGDPKSAQLTLSVQLTPPPPSLQLTPSVQLTPPSPVFSWPPVVRSPPPPPTVFSWPPPPPSADPQSAQLGTATVTTDPCHQPRRQRPTASGNPPTPLRLLGSSTDLLWSWSSRTCWSRCLQGRWRSVATRPWTGCGAGFPGWFSGGSWDPHDSPERAARTGWYLRCTSDTAGMSPWQWRWTSVTFQTQTALGGRNNWQ